MANERLYLVKLTRLDVIDDICFAASAEMVIELSRLREIDLSQFDRRLEIEIETATEKLEGRPRAMTAEEIDEWRDNRDD